MVGLEPLWDQLFSRSHFAWLVAPEFTGLFFTPEEKVRTKGGYELEFVLSKLNEAVVSMSSDSYPPTYL